MAGSPWQNPLSPGGRGEPRPAWPSCHTSALRQAEVVSPGEWHCTPQLGTPQLGRVFSSNPSCGVVAAAPPSPPLSGL